MPFIGQQPVTGAYHKLDSITASATATYNLQLNGGAYSPASANHLLVSLNGVIQAPQDSFTISGSTITFASALTASDNIDFIMAFGDVLSVGVPTDGSVNTTQLANDAVTTAKIGASQVTDAKIVGMSSSKLTGALRQDFVGARVYGSSNTVLNTTANVKVTGLNTESWDIGGYFDTSNSRYTPGVAGYYLANASFNFNSGMTSGNFVLIKWYKNGSELQWHRNHADSGDTGVQGTAVIPMNGTTDYLEVYCYINSGDSTETIEWSGGVRSWVEYSLIGVS